MGMKVLFIKWETPQMTIIAAQKQTMNYANTAKHKHWKFDPSSEANKTFLLVPFQVWFNR